MHLLLLATMSSGSNMRWCLAAGGLSRLQATPWPHRPVHDFPGQVANTGLLLAALRAMRFCTRKARMPLQKAEAGPPPLFLLSAIASVDVFSVVVTCTGGEETPLVGRSITMHLRLLATRSSGSNMRWCLGLGLSRLQATP